MPAPILPASSHIPSTSASTCAAGVSPGAPKPTTNAVAPRAHRLDVGGVLGDRLAADVVRRRPVQPEMPVLHQHVGRHHDPAVAGRPPPPRRRRARAAPHAGWRRPRTRRSMTANSPSCCSVGGPRLCRRARHLLRRLRPCEATYGRTTRGTVGTLPEMDRRCARGEQCDGQVPDTDPGGPPRALIIAAIALAVVAIGVVLVARGTRQDAAQPVAIPAVPAPQAADPACRALAAALPQRLGDYQRAPVAQPAPPGASRLAGRAGRRAGGVCAADSTARPTSWSDPRSRSSTGCSGSRCGRTAIRR